MNMDEELLLERVRIPTRHESRYAGQYAGMKDLKSLIDQLAQTADRAVTSRNNKMAQSSYELAIELYHQILSLRPEQELRQLSEQAMKELVGRYPGLVAVNRAVAYCDLAKQAKTLSDQVRYLSQAKSVLEDALSTPGIGAEGQRDLHRQVVDHLEEANRRLKED